MVKPTSHRDCRVHPGWWEIQDPEHKAEAPHHSLPNDNREIRSPASSRASRSHLDFVPIASRPAGRGHRPEPGSPARQSNRPLNTPLPSGLQPGGRRYRPSKVRIARRVGQSAYPGNHSRILCSRWRLARVRGGWSKKAERGQVSRDRGIARHESAFDADGITGQSQAGGGDTGRPIGGGLVYDQTIGRIYLLEEVIEGLALQQLQLRRTRPLPGADDISPCPRTHGSMRRSPTSEVRLHRIRRLAFNDQGTQ